LAQELILPREYETLLTALKERIRSAQLEALRSVNREQISLYADIGQMIVEKQQGETWGKSIVGNLADDLRKEFPGANGFSAANLWRMKSFYEAYGRDEKLAQLVREIGWSHNIAILEKCKSEQEREFYIRSCRKHGWSRSVLIHQIENQTFQRTISSQTNFANALDPEVSIHAQLAVKDEYTFAFLELEDEHSERELERALTGRVETFLREMGDMFTFVGSQYKLQVGSANSSSIFSCTIADSMHSWHWNSKSASLNRNTSARCSSTSRSLTTRFVYLRSSRRLVSFFASRRTG
jgi:predicted nuclease of restriction endonuclease-like (RecB) superfamily